MFILLVGCDAHSLLLDHSLSLILTPFAGLLWGEHGNSLYTAFRFLGGVVRATNVVVRSCRSTLLSHLPFKDLKGANMALPYAIYQHQIKDQLSRTSKKSSFLPNQAFGPCWISSSAQISRGCYHDMPFHITFHSRTFNWGLNFGLSACQAHAIPLNCGSFLCIRGGFSPISFPFRLPPNAAVQFSFIQIFPHCNSR